MRNALVLVPLCIGLTCGFIVPTGTSEANNVTQSTATFNPEATITDEDIIRNNVERVDSDLQDMKHDEERQELYNEGSEENKTIEERSFIFVNQRWSKLPYRSSAVDSKLPNSLVNNQNLQTASILNVFREDPRENVVPQGGTVHTKYLNDKHEQDTEYNKARNKNYHTTHGIENKNNSNYGINLKHHAQNTVTENKNNFIEFLKTSIVRPSIKSTENTLNNNKNKYPNSINRKHFIEFNTGNIETYRNQKQNITKERKKEEERKEENENTPFYRNRIQDLVNNQYVNLVKDQKLFHLLLEEPVPHKQILYKNHSSTYNLKYCRKCVLLAKLSNLNYETECDCRCGRYIHLKGRI